MELESTWQVVILPPGLPMEKRQQGFLRSRSPRVLFVDEDVSPTTSFEFWLHAWLQQALPSAPELWAGTYVDLPGSAWSVRAYNRLCHQWLWAAGGGDRFLGGAFFLVSAPRELSLWMKSNVYGGEEVLFSKLWRKQGHLIRLAEGFQLFHGGQRSWFGFWRRAWRQGLAPTATRGPRKIWSSLPRRLGGHPGVAFWALVHLLAVFFAQGFLRRR